MAAPGQASPFVFPDVTTRSCEFVGARETPLRVAPGAGCSDEGRCLSDYDQCLIALGPVGAGVLFEAALDVPLLREALSDALTDLPWFAGRFIRRQVRSGTALCGGHIEPCELYLRTAVLHKCARTHTYVYVLLCTQTVCGSGPWDTRCSVDPWDTRCSVDPT